MATPPIAALREGSVLDVNGHDLVFLAHPKYSDAHRDGEAPSSPEVLCEQCAIARRKDTGELVLLWLCGGISWSVSRNDPNYEKHRIALGVVN